MVAPLRGLKILDFSTLLPGPYATQQLADLGAQVLRVESPSRPDLVRNMEPQVSGQSAAFHQLNRGKLSLALDLKNDAAIQIIRRLVADYDVLIEQFRPGVMSRLGLGYEQLKSINPKLIYCSITGYGQDGEFAQRAGHDLNYLSLSGVSSYLGRAAESPLPLPLQVADIAGGSMNALIALLAALYEREQNGTGRHIDISMTDSCFAMHALFAPGALQTETDPVPQDNFLTGAGIYDYYRTADDRYLSVASLEPQFRSALCEALEEPQWTRLQDDELKPKLQQRFLQQPLSHWQALFNNVDACVEPVMTLNEVASSRLMRDRNMVITSGEGASTPLKQIASPFCFDGKRPQPEGLAPELGQHRQQVLEAVGYSAADIEELNRQNVFG